MSEDTPPQGIPAVTSTEGWMILVAERLARIETELKNIRKDREADVQQREDHENRLRSLERWRYMLPTSFLGALVSAGVTIYSVIGR